MGVVCIGIEPLRSLTAVLRSVTPPPRGYCPAQHCPCAMCHYVMLCSCFLGLPHALFSFCSLPPSHAVLIRPFCCRCWLFRLFKGIYFVVFSGWFLNFGKSDRYVATTFWFLGWTLNKSKLPISFFSIKIKLLLFFPNFEFCSHFASLYFHNYLPT